jgi:hypothetical protein
MGRVDDRRPATTTDDGVKSFFLKCRHDDFSSDPFELFSSQSTSAACHFSLTLSNGPSEAMSIIGKLVFQDVRSDDEKDRTSHNNLRLVY